MSGQFSIVEIGGGPMMAWPFTYDRLFSVALGFGN